MADEHTPNMDPKEGSEALFDLIKNIADAASDNDLSQMKDVIAKMGGIVEATGVSIPGIDERLAALQQQTSGAHSHIENSAAALWVGDLDRSKLLMEADPAVDYAALGLSELGIEPSDDSKFEEEDGEDNWRDDPEFAAIFAEFGADPEGVDDPDDILPDRYEGIANGDPGAIDEFLATGEDPNLPTGEAQHTALLAALDAPGRRAESIQKLIDAGADPMQQHAFGDNAISWAMGYHHPETVTADSERTLIALLASHGVDVNHEIPGQWVTLHRAIIQGTAEQVGAFLAVGPDITANVFSQFYPEKLAGATPVMLAAPKPDILQMLLDYGADASAPDDHGRLPYDFVRKEAHAARARATEDDPWTIAHAEALESSLEILDRHITS